MKQSSPSMLGTSCENSQFLKPFYQILSSREECVRPALPALSFIHFSCQFEQRNLGGDRDRRRVILQFTSSAKPTTPYKVTLCVNTFRFFDVPLLKTINVSGYVRAAINFFAISGRAIPEDLHLKVIVVDRTQELSLLVYLADSGCGIGDMSTTKAQAANVEDPDVIVDRVTVLLNCPLQRTRLVAPCRGADCRHMQCFDALAYLRLNEATIRPSWRCPVCDKDVEVQGLRMDPFTMEVLRRVAKTCDTVQALGWTAVDKRVDVISVSSARTPRWPRPVNAKRETSVVSVVDLTDDVDA
ncbi:E3 SUMO-protein ligase PIAS1-like [Ixodes scapularis]|uniref:E3 SUMO-protein ligase PIAS1-like n=1 Tax=Ixodes scapularis TaxID=6945 RepID=UPI001A9E6878|nr:E3 SUMO-protein ligase PIAS1-like [Ixodes scapularis]